MVNSKKDKAATSPEEQETLMVNLAHQQALNDLREGKASQQVVMHFLKIGSSREKIEREKLLAEAEVASSKAQALKSQQANQSSAEEAVKAMRGYKSSDD